MRLGRKQSKEEKGMRSKSAKRAGIGKWMKGRSGDKHWNWQGGLTKD